MPIPLLIALGALALKGGSGVALGYGANKALEGDDYTGKDAIYDFGTGLISIPGAGRAGRLLGKGGGKILPRLLPGAGSARPLPRYYAPGLPRVMHGPVSKPNYFLRPNTRAANAAERILTNRWGGGLSRLGRGIGTASLVVPDAPYSSFNSIFGPPLRTDTSPNNLPTLTGPSLGGSDEANGIEIGSLINYTPGKAPAFNKTLADYMKDQTLRDIVQQNINATNMPLFSANKATRKRMANEIAQNNYIARTLQADYNKRIADQQAEMKLMQDRNNARNQAMLERSAIAESDVPLTYVSGEAATAKRETTEAVANEQAMSDALIDRLAGSANEYLKELQLAQRSESSAQEQGIRQKADEEIATAMAQIRANQAQYGTLLSEAAAQQYAQDIAKYNADIEAYNAAENRKYQQSSDNVSAYINLLGNSGQSQETKSTISSYTRRLNKLQDRLDKLNTEYTIDEKNGKEVLKSRTSKGKKEVKAITNQIAQINNELAALGAI